VFWGGEGASGCFRAGGVSRQPAPLLCVYVARMTGLTSRKRTMYPGLTTQPNLGMLRLRQQARKIIQIPRKLSPERLCRGQRCVSSPSAVDGWVGFRLPCGELRGGWGRALPVDGCGWMSNDCAAGLPGHLFFSLWSALMRTEVGFELAFRGQEYKSGMRLCYFD
jgi:hypothetical protein